MHANTIREPAVAGLFYPADQAVCDKEVSELLRANACAMEQIKPKALIAPHAGYMYSGAVAAKAYNLLSQFAPAFKRVVLMGPCHRVALAGMALSSASYYKTPLGLVPLECELAASILSYPDVEIEDLAHAQEHSLEVHVPFLQKVLGDFSLLPIVVGRVSAQSVARVIQAVWQDPETLVIVSSDLSHFLSYDEALRMDENTSLAIESCATNLSGEQACGSFALNGLLAAATTAQLSVRRISLANSADAVGDRSRVVGYGAYVVH